MNPNANIYIAGHRGMVGSAPVRQFKARGYTNLITRGRMPCLTSPTGR